MADIELVVKIPEDVFKRTVFYREFRDLNDCVTTIKALEKAVPLPKGHGKIIDENKQLVEELSKMPHMVIVTAYLYAINYTLYGEDVTEKWITATQNASALGKAYRKGCHDALQRREESDDQ